MDVQSRKNIKYPRSRKNLLKSGCIGDKDSKISKMQEESRENWMFRAEKPSNVQNAGERQRKLDVQSRKNH